MPSYSTQLTTWGSSGQEPPDGYSYVEGEQPVDAWDNFVAYHIAEDINHLVDVTNNDLLAADGSTPLAGDLTDDVGNLIWDNDNRHVPLNALERDTIEVVAGDAIDDGGTVQLGGSVTLNHSVAGLTNDYDAPVGYAISGMKFDDYGHPVQVTGTDFDARYILETGDSMSGNLNMSGNSVTNTGTIDSDGSGVTIRNGASTPRAKFEEDGDLSIEGELTENATL